MSLRNDIALLQRYSSKRSENDSRYVVSEYVFITDIHYAVDMRTVFKRTVLITDNLSVIHCSHDQRDSQGAIFQARDKCSTS